MHHNNIKYQHDIIIIILEILPDFEKWENFIISSLC